MLLTTIAIIGAALGGAASLIGGAFAVNDYANKKKQERQNYVSNTLEPLLNQYETDINNAIGDYNIAKNLIADYEYRLYNSLPTQMETYEEWISLYEGMLKGEDNLFSDQQDILQSNISIAESSVTGAQNAIDTYTSTSALEIEQIYTSARESIGSARRQQALMNVAASAAGAVTGSHSVANLKIQSDLVRYAGEDLALDENDESTFARAVSARRSEIADELFQLNQALEIAKNSKLQAETELEDWSMQMEAQYADTLDNVAQTNILITQTEQALENERKNLADASKTAMEAISNYSKTADELRSEYGDLTSMDVSLDTTSDKIVEWKRQLDRVGSGTSLLKSLEKAFGSLSSWLKGSK